MSVTGKPSTHSCEAAGAVRLPVAKWSETRTAERFERTDGGRVQIDHEVRGKSSQPWLPNYRGWMAYGPKSSVPLSYRRAGTVTLIVRKFKTAAAAMAAVDAEFAPDGSSQQTLL